MNHWASCCNTKLVQEATATYEYLIEAVTRNEDKDIHVEEATIILKINGKMVKAKIDTGAEVDVMPKRVFDQISNSNLKPTNVKLRGYGGDSIPVLGTTKMMCEHKQDRHLTNFFVVETRSKPFLASRHVKFCARSNYLQK